MSCDVLRGNAVFALAQGLVITALVVCGKLALGVGIKIGAVASQGKHEQELGIQAGRGDVRGSEAGDRGS